MAHTYASLAKFKDFLRDEGATKYSTVADEIMLEILEASSRRVDEYAERSPRFGSGFGPRIGTNRYDPPCGQCLELDDDLLSITSVTTYDTVGGTATTLTDETDFYKEPYGGTPYRRLRIHEASSAAWGTATRGGGVIVGSWGERDERVASTTTVSSGLASEAAATTFTTSASPTIQVGQTLRIGTEQIYLTALSGTTATVERGANGTTAAVHANASAIDVYQYHPRVVRTTMRIGHLEWKARDAGNSPNYGGGQIPTTSPTSSEWSILNAGLSGLAYRSAD